MVWDRVVRLFHWALAAGVITNYWVLEAGEEPHEWLGYALAALVVIRIIWGFAGPREAQFRNFLVGPRRAAHSVLNFSDDYGEHTGHSPLAGWMIVVLLTLVLALAVTGWMQDLDAFWGEEWLQDLHERLGDGLIVAAAFHVTAVFYIQWRFRLPLLRSMIGGRWAPPRSR